MPDVILHNKHWDVLCPEAGPVDTVSSHGMMAYNNSNATSGFAFPQMLVNGTEQKEKVGRLTCNITIQGRGRAG